ncbi:hypothetical protein [Lactococcus lactis]|uniref:Uncharacterized protein (DUF2384 family) n=1 Tax=Lactococcus lactis TaxID=1358 RepID=A0AAW5TTX3_9LACT|nr:hypothetical protein [Lactococcus lactis]MCW2280445.1 uncharacterized protein (DUF2384 family) [Lactococcus lactis]
MEQLENIIKSNLIGVNEALKLVFSGKSKLTTRELAEQVGERIWKIAEILGVELD